MLRYIIFPKANLSTRILVHAISCSQILTMDIWTWATLKSIVEVCIKKGLNKISVFYGMIKCMFQVLNPLILKHSLSYSCTALH